MVQITNKAQKSSEAPTGFEPMTSAIPMRCSTNWAMKPLWKQVKCPLEPQNFFWALFCNCSTYFITARFISYRSGCPASRARGWWSIRATTQISAGNSILVEGGKPEKSPRSQIEINQSQPTYEPSIEPTTALTWLPISWCKKSKKVSKL